MRGPFEDPASKPSGLFVPMWLCNCSALSLRWHIHPESTRRPLAWLLDHRAVIAYISMGECKGIYKNREISRPVCNSHRGWPILALLSHWGSHFTQCRFPQVLPELHAFLFLQATFSQPRDEQKALAWTCVCFGCFSVFCGRHNSPL